MSGPAAGGAGAVAVTAPAGVGSGAGGAGDGAGSGAVSGGGGAGVGPDGGAVAAGGPAGAVAAPRPRLHVPDEPEARRDGWYRAVLDGAAVEDVVLGPDGVAAWLWPRWRILEAAGVDRAAFETVLTGYRRELWLWLAGERTWAQCCAGLAGRTERRIPA